MKTIPIAFVWKLRLALIAEGNTLIAEGNTLWAKGNTLWAEAVIEAYGNVTMKWIIATKCMVNGTDTYGE